MGYGRPSWIAEHLLGPDQARTVQAVHSASVLYGTTAGPFGGIGGAALTTFQMTLVVTDTVALVFADERVLGWLPAADADPLVDAWVSLDASTNLRGLLRTPDTCPVASASTT